MMDVSVIIVNYNVRDFLHNALTSIARALQGIASEVFVVDNASDDGSNEMVKKTFPSVHLIPNTTNTGFAAANNQALRLAQGRYLVLINPDTVVQEDTFRSLISFLDSRQNVGLAGCKILNPDGTLQLACRRSFPSPWVAFTKVSGLSSLFPSSRWFAKYNLTYLDPDQMHEVDAVSGSFMMLRREVYEKIGGLDETFFMYGEDLDWCYRAQQAGWKVFYVPVTSIIHYKGESTRRSSIDELREFYRAMKLFVRKHHRGSLLTGFFIEAGIQLRSLVAMLARFSRPLVAAIADAALLLVSLLLSSFVVTKHVGTFPSYAYPWVFLVPVITMVGSLYGFGVYSWRKLSVSRSFIATVFAFLVIAALTAFFKQYAFGRMLVLMTGALCLFFIPGWRLAARMTTASGSPLLGRRTLIVGVDDSAVEVLRRLRAKPEGGYEVIGFIDLNRQRLGESILGVEILGSVETVGKVIDEYNISEVIFSTDAIPYSTILSVIGKSRSRMVNFRLVPTTLEVMIGKGGVDQLGDIPFIDIEYNINRLLNRGIKRTVDIAVSLFFLIWVVPFVYFLRAMGKKQTSFSRAMLLMSQVLSGKYSFIGRDPAAMVAAGIYLGKPGITGMVQIHGGAPMSDEECSYYELYYAKNQSFALDFEILLKTVMRWMQRSVTKSRSGYGKNSP
jgi:GT2 family glycosyltransferase/lipopolysaccharide/colanic/teichoic acid biosynthesis glycosyltransferase